VDEIPFQGKTVLDIGCWDGAWSYLAEQKGAARVLGVDDPSFRWGGLDGYEYLHDHFQSKAEWVKGNVYDLPPERFDIVLCYGVLYHLSDPLLAASNCFQAAKEMVAFEGNFYHSHRPSMLLWASREISEDTSNVCSLSTAFMDLVAKQNGFVRCGTLIRPRGVLGVCRLNGLRSNRSMKKDRGTLLYKRVAHLRPGYPDSCLPRPIIKF